MSPETGNAHDSDDCIEWLCDHPDHEVEGGIPDLTFILEHPGVRVRELDLVMGPVYL